MANSTVNVLEAVFVAFGSVMVATLIYTLAIDGLPFRKDLLTPVWVVYKESNWLAAVLWIILLACLGSITTCLYITIQLFKLSAEEAIHDPVYHLLLRGQDKKGAASGSSSRLISAEVFFSALGCLMLGMLLYTILTYGSPFNKEILKPWLIATLIDFYINVAILSVWVCYKEPNWYTTSIWILLLICLAALSPVDILCGSFFYFLLMTLCTLFC